MLQCLLYENSEAIQERAKITWNYTLQKAIDFCSPVGKVQV